MGDCLELRQRLKESIRLRRKNDGGRGADVCSEGKDYRFGCFFGPCETVISERVKDLLKDKDITPMLSKMWSQSNSSQNKNYSASRPKLGVRVAAPKPSSWVLKSARDYSFLSDGAELPGPTSESDQAPSKTKPQLAKSDGEERRPVPRRNGQMCRWVDSEKQQQRVMSNDSDSGTLPSKKISTQKEAIPKMQSSKPHVTKSSEIERRPQKKQQSSEIERRPKKKQQLSENDKALMMVRNMIGSKRRHRVWDDDDDDDDISNMEASFDEIVKEEKTSAKLARKEDAEELRKIEEEERLRRQAKKRKL